MRGARGYARAGDAVHHRLTPHQLCTPGLRWLGSVGRAALYPIIRIGTLLQRAPLNGEHLCLLCTKGRACIPARALQTGRICKQCSRMKRADQPRRPRCAHCRSQAGSLLPGPKTQSWCTRPRRTRGAPRLWWPPPSLSATQLHVWKPCAGRYWRSARSWAGPRRSGMAEVALACESFMACQKPWAGCWGATALRAHKTRTPAVGGPWL